MSISSADGYLLTSDITTWLRANALGHANAKPRRLLLAYLRSQGHSIDDRQMRKSYESLERIGSCGRGLFWITNAEDRRIAQGQLAAPAAAMFKRERKIGAVVEGQGSLFGGEA